jgi:hypothetical protein
MKRNLSTAENRAYWKYVKDTAKEVSHWPKWMGGGGVEPLQCPTCRQNLPKEGK